MALVTTRAFPIALLLVVQLQLLGLPTPALCDPSIVVASPPFALETPTSLWDPANALLVLCNRSGAVTIANVSTRSLQIGISAPSCAVVINNVNIDQSLSIDGDSDLRNVTVHPA